MTTREEIIAKAIGDDGSTTRAHAVLEALHRAGFSIQQPPTDGASLAMSLRERGSFADADAVDALSMELDLMRRGWGPSTPTERMLRRVDLITARSFIERMYAELIELNLNNYTEDDVAELNNGAIQANQIAHEGMKWINGRLAHDLAGIPDRNNNERDQIGDATRAVAEGPSA